MSKFVEQSGGSVIAAVRGGESEKNGIVGGLALLGAMQRVEPGFEFLTALGETQRGIVGKIVTLAHEGVNGAQGLALASRKHEEGVVEILGGGAGDAAAHGIRHDQLRRSWAPRDGGLLD